jgi:hypothetical protein
LEREREDGKMSWIDKLMCCREIKRQETETERDRVARCHRLTRECVAERRKRQEPGAESKMSYDDVEIEDMEWNDEIQAFTYPCPCGDLFQITKVQASSPSLVSSLFWKLFFVNRQQKVRDSANHMLCFAFLERASVELKSLHQS